MSKKTYAIALAALLGTTPIAFAAQPAHSTATPAVQGLVIQPNQIRASKMIGSRVYYVQNRKHWEGAGPGPGARWYDRSGRCRRMSFLRMSGKERGGEAHRYQNR